MGEQYVKFLRGTLSEFLSLNKKDEDTLYFIYNEANNTTSLYLGDSLIAGHGKAISTSLSELSDVIINTVSNR